MYDWVTPGDLKSLNGAKAADYEQAGLPQRPTYKPFETFDEVGQVMNVDILDKAKPDWKNSFTLWSAGPLDIREAPADLIAAIFGIDPQRVAMFVSMRNGRDGIPGTSDDVSIGGAVSAPGRTGPQRTANQDLRQPSFLRQPRCGASPAWAALVDHR